MGFRLATKNVSGLKSGHILPHSWVFALKASVRISGKSTPEEADHYSLTKDPPLDAPIKKGCWWSP